MYAIFRLKANFKASASPIARIQNTTEKKKTRKTPTKRPIQKKKKKNNRLKKGEIFIKSIKKTFLAETTLCFRRFFTLKSLKTQKKRLF